MSLRSKLFGAIGLTLCVVLGIIATVTLLQERERVARMDAFRKGELELAAVLAASVSTEALRDKLVLEANGDLHPHFTALGVWRRDESGELRPVVMFGPALRDESARTAARAMVDEALRTRRRVRRGDAIAVHARASRDEAVAGWPPSTGVYLEIVPLVVDPVRVSQVSFLVIVAAGVLLLLVTWFIVDRVVARPLREVVLGANRVAVGDYGTLVPASGGDDEIQKVIASFNSMMVELGLLQGRMQDRIGEALLTARRTQDTLVIAQRLASTGRLAAGIAHEVNNPLGGMLNAVHSLRTKEMPPAKREEYIDLVEDGLRRIQATVAKILQFTPHKVAPQKVDLTNVVRPVVALVRHRVEKAGVAVELDLSPEPATVFGDPYELQQALLNVVLNALDAVDEADRPEPAIVLRTRVEDQEVRLLVRDNGVGMKDEDVPRAFDLFFTTKDPGRGTGLGLATAHKILTDHGGRIELHPRGTDGMDVEFVLPRLGG